MPNPQCPVKKNGASCSDKKPRIPEYWTLIIRYWILLPRRSHIFQAKFIDKHGKIRLALLLPVVKTFFKNKYIMVRSAE